jgi:hypothetical protein
MRGALKRMAIEYRNWTVWTSLDSWLRFTSTTVWIFDPNAEYANTPEPVKSVMTAIMTPDRT